MPRFGIDVVLAHPPEYELMEDSIEYAKKEAKKKHTKFEITNNMEEAFKDADIVYPKSWGLKTMFDKSEKALKVAEKYKNWICDNKIMKLTKPNSIYMHCLPADRGKEVTDSVIDGKHSVVYDQAENRLHTCKAIMAMIM